MIEPTDHWFEFGLVVSGFNMDEPGQLDTLLGGFDGNASVTGTTTDLVEVLVTTSFKDPMEAVDEAIDQLRGVNGVVVERVDEGLVSISDIARMTERSRESIRLLADGKRGSGRFPAPAGVVGDSVRVWRWTDVEDWMRRYTEYTFATRPLPSWVVDTVNAKLQKIPRRRRTKGMGKARAVG